MLSLCWKPVFPKRTVLQNSASWSLHLGKRALNLARTTLDLHAGPLDAFYLPLPPHPTLHPHSSAAKPLRFNKWGQKTRKKKRKEGKEKRQKGRKDRRERTRDGAREGRRKGPFFWDRREGSQA